MTDLLTTATSRDEADRRAQVAVLPIGSFEQHGDHLPLITDTIVACAIAREIAEAYDLFLLPPITISCSHEHAAWAGTVSIGAATLYAVIADIRESLRRSGVEKLVLVNGHGGNYVLKNVVQEASVEGPNMAIFPGPEDWKRAREYATMKTSDHEDMHAGELETSILMHVNPSLIRSGIEAADWRADERPHLLTVGLSGYTPTGVIGRPSLGTAEKGKSALAGLVRLFPDSLDITESGKKDHVHSMDINKNDGLVSGNMTYPRGFWSYVHKDDEAEGGRIAQLARDVVAQYEMITGDEIELFLDQDQLEWGDDWRPKVDMSLTSGAFFIPVLTPRYFQSTECRRELNFFARQATSLGVRELVMPILYIDFAGIHEDPPSDDAMALVKSFQWEQWSELRFAAPNSSEYRAAVARLADRLARANAAADKADVSGAALALSESDDNAQPGIMDLLARAEEAMPEWIETINEIPSQIEAVGAIAEQATQGLGRAEAQGKGFAAKIVIMREMAKSLKEPGDRLNELGNKFASQLNDVDQGIRVIIEKAPAEVAQDPSARLAACDFFESIRGMATSAEEGLGALKGLVDAIAPVEAMSRDVRKPLRTLRQGLTMMYEGMDVIRSWVALIDDSPILCEPVGRSGASTPAGDHTSGDR